MTISEEVSEPEVTISEVSDLEVSEEVSEPETTVSEEVSEPETTVSEEVSEPEVSEPETTVSEPETTVSEPEVTVSPEVSEPVISKDIVETLPSVEIIKTEDKIDLDKKIDEAITLSPSESKEIIKQIECLDGDQFDINEKRCLPCSHYQLVWDSETRLCKQMLKDQVSKEKEKEILSSNMVLQGLDIVVNDKNNIIGYIEK